MTCDNLRPLESLADLFTCPKEQLCFLWARSLKMPDYWEVAGIGPRETCELRSGNPMFRNAETVILPATETPILEATR